MDLSFVGPIGGVHNHLGTVVPLSATGHMSSRGARPLVVKRRSRVCMTAAKSNQDGGSLNDDSLDAMRSRLEGLFGGSDDVEVQTDGEFDGSALRKVVRDRFTVEYDMHPVVRNDRVFIHILWRYFEQVSFPLEEEEWAEHCEAVANLLKKWGAVDSFCDYVTTCKKRPVVGISLHVPIPGIVRGHPLFPTSDRFD